MKVLFLTHSFPRQPGDAAGLVRAAPRDGAARRGHRHERRRAGRAGTTRRTTTLDDIPVERFHYAPRRSRRSPTRATWRRRCRRRGARASRCSDSSAPNSGRPCALRREFKPDVVHAHWWFPNGLVGTWLGRMANKPLVTTLHGSDVRLARSVAFSRPAFRHVLHRSAAVTAVSRWLASRGAGRSSRRRRRSSRRCPWPPTCFRPAASADANRLLFVGRLNKQKGIETPAARDGAHARRLGRHSTSSATARIATRFEELAARARARAIA